MAFDVGCHLVPRKGFRLVEFLSRAFALRPKEELLAVRVNQGVGLVVVVPSSGQPWFKLVCLKRISRVVPRLEALRAKTRFRIKSWSLKKRLLLSPASPAWSCPSDWSPSFSFGVVELGPGGCSGGVAAASAGEEAGAGTGVDGLTAGVPGSARLAGSESCIRNGIPGRNCAAQA